MLFVALLAALIALPLATFAALHKDSVFDQVIRGTFMVTLAMPAFWVGIILILVLSVNLHLFPVTGFGDTVISHLWHLFLPALTTVLVTPVGFRSHRTLSVSAPRLTAMSG